MRICSVAARGGSEGRTLKMERRRRCAAILAEREEREGIVGEAEVKVE